MDRWWGPIESGVVVLGSRGGAALAVLAWVGVLGVFVVIGGVVALRLRKRMLEGVEPEDTRAGLLQQLRAMHDRGELTEAEFRSARDRVLGRATPRARPARLHGEITEDGGLRARPGMDLTGDPLPTAQSRDRK